MKGARILALAAAALIAVNASANAAGRVWFDASAATTNGSVLSAPGSPTLELQCDISQGLRCDWLITIMYQNDDGGATGWSLDIGTLNPEDNGKFTIKDVQLSTGGLNSPGLPPLSINNPNGLLVEGIGGSNTTPQPAGLYNLATIRLSKNKLPGELNTSFIYAGIGFSEFGGDDAEGFGFYEVVSLGANPPVPGFNPGSWPDNAGQAPLIIVRNVPEPATLSLIGLGALALIRRRK